MGWDIYDKDKYSLIKSLIRKHYYLNGGDPEGLQDCIQEILCRILEGKHKKSQIKYAVIDYLRANKKRYDLCWDDLYDPPKVYQKDLADKDLFEQVFKKVVGKKKKVLELYLLGHRMSEIADILKIGISRVSQIFGEIGLELKYLNKD